MKKRNYDKQKNPFGDFPDKFFIYEDNDDTDLFHEKTFIGTELGGEGHLLRNYVVISTKTNTSLSEKQKQIIKDTFTKVCRQYDSQIEEVEFSKTYALIKVLISMNIAIEQALDEGIIACKKQDDFLRFHYYVTNVKKPTAKEIQEYLALDEVKRAK